MDAQKTVFISYRRSTSKYLARAIYEHLRTHSYDVFLDVNTIDSGAFDEIILRQIAARAHFVVLLTPGSLERCVNEDDWLRREIVEAMKLRRNIIPIVEEGFDFQREMQALPPQIRNAFSRYNALPLTHFYFDAAMNVLTNRFLKEPIAHVKLVPLTERVRVDSRVAQIVTRRKAFPRQRTSAATEEAPSELTRCTQAIERDPDDRDAYYRRANLHYKSGRIDEAIDDYHEVLRLDPRCIDAYIERADAFNARGNCHNAFNDYAQAIILNPRYPRIFYHRAAIYLQQNDLMRAINDYQKYLNLGGGIRFNNQAQVEQQIADLQRKAHAAIYESHEKRKTPAVG